MRRSEREPLARHSVKLFAGDFEYLQDLYPRLGAGKVIRELVRKHISTAKEAAAQKQTTVDLGSINL
jgi:hypothetical protein